MSEDKLTREQELEILVSEIARQLTQTDTDSEYSVYKKAETFDSVCILITNNLAHVLSPATSEPLQQKGEQ